MNVPLIEMDAGAAAEKAAAYESQLRRRDDPEYAAAAVGYAALAEGTPLLNLREAFAHTGLGEDGRPKLAIARADRKQVYVRVRSNDLEFSTLKRSSWNYAGSLLIHVPFTGIGERWKDGYSLVPLVPADVRPSEPLHNFLILWEVEQWADRPFIAQPDRDPYLLRHLVGELYAVVAEWDLTDLERAIMAGRREG
jgi:hypothetical protein